MAPRSPWAFQVLILVELLLAVLTIEGRQFHRPDAARRTMEASKARFRHMAEHSQDPRVRDRLDPPGFEYASPSWGGHHEDAC